MGAGPADRVPATGGAQRVRRPARLPAGSGTGQAGGGSWLGLVLLVAVGLRCYPWLRAHTFLGLQEGDDGIYYGAAKLLLHGRLPYRDVTLVHPPGISLLLLPFAAVGDHLGDDVGLAAARVATVLVAVLDIFLLHRLVRRLPAGSPRRAQLAALSAAAVYAVMPNAVLAEHTVLLEAWVNLFCLLALTACGPGHLRRPGRRPSRPDVSGRPAEPARRDGGRWLLTGLALAAALSVKLFAGAYLLALAGWLLANRQPRSLLRLLLGVSAGIALFDLPFVAAAPHAFWQDVVVTQLSRPADATANGVARLLDMTGVGLLPAPVGLALLGLVVLGVLAQQRRGPGSPLLPWLLAGGIVVVAFLRAASYFPHYGAFLAPPLAVLVSRFVAAERRPARGVAATWAVPAVLLAVFAVAAVRADLSVRGQPDLQLAGALVRPGSCVYYEQASVAVAAGVLGSPSTTCPMWLDSRGALYASSTHWPRLRPFYFQGFTSNARWQRSTVDQLHHADYLLLSRAPGSIREWSPATRDYALRHFRPELLLGPPGLTHSELWNRFSRG